MNRKTIKSLKALNQQFYQKWAKQFSQTRQSPWSGWNQVLEHANNLPEKINVLDLGCGNGRFGEFLISRGRWGQYTGIDSSVALLAEAKKKLAEASIKVIEADLTDSNRLRIMTGMFDLVVMFGVLHHLPSYQGRLQLIKAAWDKVGPGGYLVISWWQFDQDEKEIKKIVAKTKPEFEAILGKAIEVEPGDYILSFGGLKKWRYCHALQATESQKLLAELSIKLDFDFWADGKSGQLNYYWGFIKR